MLNFFFSFWSYLGSLLNFPSPLAKNGWAQGLHLPALYFSSEVWKAIPNCNHLAYTKKKKKKLPNHKYKNAKSPTTYSTNTFSFTLQSYRFHPSGTQLHSVVKLSLDYRGLPHHSSRLSLIQTGHGCYHTLEGAPVISHRYFS